MHARHVAGAAAVVAVTFLGARLVWSQEGPSEAEMWKAMEERAKPVEEHTKVLAPLAGTWDAEITCVRNGVEKKSTGTMSSELELGGRVLVSNFRGTMDGRAFEGLELRGYDKDKRQHWVVWTDSLGTGYLPFHGDPAKDGVITTKSGEYDFMGKKYVSTAVTRTVDPDHLVFDMVNTSPGQSDEKMTIRYSRRR